MTRAPHIHVVGAGLAGLSAAVALAARGMRVILSEAAPQAGGRCRSYRDARLGMVIDNGNHLVLSGNRAVGRYLRRIGAGHRLTAPPAAEFPFLDLRDGTRWTLRPNDGVLPWWVLSSTRRAPGAALRNYAALARLARRHPGKRIDEVLPCRGMLGERLSQPVLVSMLNTMPERGSVELAGALIRESLARGGDADHLLERDPDALLAAPWGEVAVALNLPPEPPPGRIVKERRATCAATPGQDARGPPSRMAFANLAVAGDWTATGRPATIEGALRSGETAAALALSGLLAAQNPL